MARLGIRGRLVMTEHRGKQGQPDLKDRPEQLAIQVLPGILARKVILAQKATRAMMATQARLVLLRQ
jgi:hypothetical protein